MDNYIVINGKKAELTTEQLKALGIKQESNNPYSEVAKGEPFYCLVPTIHRLTTCTTPFLNQIRSSGNYFNDKKYVNMISLRFQLYLLLDKWRCENDPNSLNLDWNDISVSKFEIFYEHTYQKHYRIAPRSVSKTQCAVYFSAYELAEKALEEVVKPFVQQHPEFVW